MYSAGSPILISSPSAQFPRSCMPKPYGLEADSRLPIATLSSSGYSIVSIIALRLKSVSFGTCSMYTGQASTHAWQVVQAPRNSIRRMFRCRDPLTEQPVRSRSPRAGASWPSVQYRRRIRWERPSLSAYALIQESVQRRCKSQPHDGVIVRDITFCNDSEIDAFGVRDIDDFVINVGEISDIFDCVARVTKPSDDDVEGDGG